MDGHGEVPGVSRSMPGALSGRMDDPAWQSFCDELDSSLVPFYKMKWVVNCILIASIASFVPLFLIIGIAIAAEAQKEGLTAGSMNTTVFLIAFGILLVGIMVATRHVSKRTKKVNEGLLMACDEISLSHPDISFKIYLMQHYIEVCMPVDALKEEGTVLTNPSSDSEDLGALLPTPEDINEAKSWKAAFDTNVNKEYYFHVGTNEVTWIKPMGFDEAYSEKMNEDNDFAGVETIEEEEVDVAEPAIESYHPEPDIDVESQSKQRVSMKQ